MIEQGEKSDIPGLIEPMLATLVKKPFTNEEWLYEVKWDGYRILSYVQKSSIILHSRGNINYTSKYPPVVKALKDLDHEVLLDGEVIAVEEDGVANFSALQRYRKGTPLQYYVFDLLWIDGYNIMHLSLTERKQILESIIPEHEVLKYNASFEDGIALFDQVKILGLEGIVAKKKSSLYVPKKRSASWLKLPIKVRVDYVIGGWSESTSGRKFKSIMLGQYEDGKLTYIHHCGGGYTTKQEKELFEKFKALEVDESPFANDVESETPVHWMQPVLVGEFEQSNKKTESGEIRHPVIFIRLRYDKSPKEVILDDSSTSANAFEDAVDDARTKVETKPEKKTTRKKSTTSKAAAESDWPKVEAKPVTSEEPLTVEGKEILLRNIEKEFWPGITKAEVIHYYARMFDYMKPYLNNRPVGLDVVLTNVHQPTVFLRGMEGHAPEWAHIFHTIRKNPKPGKSNTIEWLVCDNLPSLLYAINLDSLDIHPWNANAEHPDEPDYIPIDLDPSGDDFSKVIETAKAAKEFIDKHKLKSFVKTSGKTGLHIFLPCSGINSKVARPLSEFIAKSIHELVPEITTLSTSTSQRGDKVYVDPSQNDYLDRMAGIYCLRPYPKPNVSAPIEWKEVNNNLHPEDFNVHTIFDRIEKKGDLWQGLFDEKTKVKNGKILQGLL